MAEVSSPVDVVPRRGATTVSALGFNRLHWDLERLLCGQGIGRYFACRVKNLLPGNGSGGFRFLGVIEISEKSGF